MAVGALRVGAGLEVSGALEGRLVAAAVAGGCTESEKDRTHGFGNECGKGL